MIVADLNMFVNMHPVVQQSITHVLEVLLAMKYLLLVVVVPIFSWWSQSYHPPHSKHLNDGSLATVMGLIYIKPKMGQLTAHKNSHLTWSKYK